MGVTIVYRIYEIREGLLKEPEVHRYGMRTPLFDDCESMDEAMREIRRASDDGEASGPFTVLMIVRA